MKRTKHILSAACLLPLAAIISCNEKPQPLPEPADAQESVRISIQAAPLTKASGTEALDFESAITSFDFLVFDAATDKLLLQEHRSSGAGFTLKMVPGGKKVIAFANGGNVVPEGAVTALDSLQYRYFNFADVNEDGTRLAMYDLQGLGGVVNIIPGGENVIEVNLNRFPCRIRLRSITEELLSENVNSFSYGAACLYNVPCRYALDGTLDDTAGKRLQPLNSGVTGASAASGGSLTYKPLTTGSGAHHPLGAPVELYTYPGSEVYLGFSATINGTPYYYAVPLSGLQSNYSYDVSIVLHTLGGTDPGQPAINTGVSASVTITPWGSGDEITETL